VAAKKLMALMIHQESKPLGFNRFSHDRSNTGESRTRGTGEAASSETPAVSQFLENLVFQIP